MNKEYIIELKKEIENKFNNVKTNEELNNLKIDYMGKKGKITELSSQMKNIPNEDKKEFGILINEVRVLFNELYNEYKEKIDIMLINKKLESESIDVSLPSIKIKRGSKHPLTRVIEELEDLFVSMGYDVVDGPEVETDVNCFKKLNLPEGHPARDAQDSFYINEEYLLRTHTSTLQVRTMEANTSKTPIRMIGPGKVYRRDDDATHSHQFMQIEGLVVGEDISLANLKATLELFFKKLLGNDTKVRFRPSYFPFTEPSVEVDVTCFNCGGKGCPLCKKTGWIEVLGAGIVHPNVLKLNGYDPDKYTGFAFGPGLDRFAMFKYQIPDIRLLYSNDIRFLEQFEGNDEDNEIKY